MDRRRYFALVATVALPLAGCTGDTGTEQETTGSTDTTDGVETGSSDEDSSGDGTDGTADAEFTVVYNFRRYERLTTPDNPGVYYESDDNDQYVGVQIRVTNQTNEERSLDGFELSMLVDGDADDTSMHLQSNTEPLEAIGAGETVESWMFYTVPPDVENLEFGPTQWAEHSFDLSHDEDLEMELTEYEG